LVTSWLNYGAEKAIITTIMNNSLWRDLKLKFFKSGSPALLYIGVNVGCFVVVSLLNVLFFLTGNRGLFEVIIDRYLAFSPSPSLMLPHFYTLLTYQFIHAGFLHILFNMLWLYWMGQLLLDFIKPRQFHVIYLGGGLLGALFFAVIYNLIPVFNPSVNNATLVGASAAVMAVFAALATLVPNYNLRLLLIGDIKIKYLFLVYVLLDLIGLTAQNAGGSLSHLGGVLFGFTYIKLLQNGTDLSTLFTRKPKLKVVKNDQPKKAAENFNQKEIDTILDKISKSGYDKLSKEEKETLFKASKN
jgi:membrane associated rhomboid family serine protease